LPLPLVSIITLNYNNSEATYRFLDSIVSLEYDNYEVIVVDMDSKVDKPDANRIKNYQHTRFIQNTSNDGFSAGNNLGIRNAKGEFLFLVNNDTVLTPSILNILISTFKVDPDIALVSPRINQLDDINRIEYAGFNQMNLFTGRTSSIGFNEKDSGQYNELNDTASVHGAAMMIRADKIKELGFLPEIYFLYYEEWEFSYLAKKKNLRVMYNGAAVIYHEGSGSVEKFSSLKTYYLNRNRILFIRRNGSSIQKLFFYLYYGLLVLPKSILYFITKESGGLKPYLAAVLWNLKNKAVQ
jgi:GT2 family glycosyltransferase